MSATSSVRPSFCLRERTVNPVQSGRNSGYFSMSATSPNILSGACAMRRVVSNCGIQIKALRAFLQLLFAGCAQPGEILPGVMRGARQRARCNQQEALGVGDRLVGF